MISTSLAIGSYIRGKCLLIPDLGAMALQLKMLRT